MCGEQATNRVVLLFPPNESLSTRVRLLSLYGICFFFSTNALMTLDNANNPRINKPASFRVSPFALVRLAFSDPAKLWKYGLIGFTEKVVSKTDS